MAFVRFASKTAKTESWKSSALFVSLRLRVKNLWDGSEDLQDFLILNPVNHDNPVILSKKHGSYPHLHSCAKRGRRANWENGRLVRCAWAAHGLSMERTRRPFSQSRLHEAPRPWPRVRARAIISHVGRKKIDACGKKKKKNI